MKEPVFQLIFEFTFFLKFSGQKLDQLINGSRAGIRPGEKKDTGFDRVVL